MKIKRLLVTGGCGFIGSAFVRWVLANTSVSIINLDALTYAAQPQALALVPGGGGAIALCRAISMMLTW